MTKLNRSALLQKWVYSHEGNTNNERVFRPYAYVDKLPPSRGRMTFELGPDGNLIVGGPGPTDRTQTSTGRWELEGKNKLIFYEGSESTPSRVLHIISLSKNRLVVEE